MNRAFVVGGRVSVLHICILQIIRGRTRYITSEREEADDWRQDLDYDEGMVNMYDNVIPMILVD